MNTDKEQVIFEDKEATKRAEDARWKRNFIFTFSLIIMFGAAMGFAGKIAEFLKTWREIPDAKFALIPIAMYAMTAIGFACIFVWATLGGMLTDIEGPKYQMLRDALRQDRDDPFSKRSPGKEVSHVDE